MAKKKPKRKPKARNTNSRGREPQAHLSTRLVWTFVLLVILTAAVFYFGDIDPREVLPEMLNHALSLETEEATVPAPRDLLPQEEELAVIVLDVGQGNAVFLRSPGGKTMLVDAGEAAYSSQLSQYLDAMGVERIDVLVGTHPHSDHIGGLRSVLQNYEVDKIYMPKVEHSSNTYVKLLEEISDQGKKIHGTKGGPSETIALDEAVTIRVLAPLSDSYSSLNDYSIALHVEYANHSILLTGDAEKRSEKEMLSQLGELLPSTVLLVGHHGSNTSSYTDFLDAVSPEAAVISCGENNDYDHPHQDVLDSLEDRNIAVYRTDRQGCVGVYFSAENWEIRTEKAG